MNRIVHIGKKLIVISIILGLLGYLALAVYVGIMANTNSATASDVIIVLGARSYINGAYNPCLLKRVEQGVKLYKEKTADAMIMAGGRDEEDASIEALVMSGIAENRGVPEKHVLLEPMSTSTYENLLYSKRIMTKQELQSAVIVSDPYHLARASLVARKLGLEHTLSPAADSPCWAKGLYFTRYFLLEPIAIAVYFLQGKL